MQMQCFKACPDGNSIKQDLRFLTLSTFMDIADNRNKFLFAWIPGFIGHKWSNRQTLDNRENGEEKKLCIPIH